MIESFLIWLFCRRGYHAKKVESRYRLTMIERGRRVVAGRIESRVVCSRCGVQLTGWQYFDQIDLTDVSLPDSDWERLFTEGEAVFPIGDDEP